MAAITSFLLGSVCRVNVLEASRGSAEPGPFIFIEPGPFIFILYLYSLLDIMPSFTSRRNTMSTSLWTDLRLNVQADPGYWVPGMVEMC